MNKMDQSCACDDYKL